MDEGVEGAGVDGIPHGEAAQEGLRCQKIREEATERAAFFQKLPVSSGEGAVQNSADLQDCEDKLSLFGFKMGELF